MHTSSYVTRFNQPHQYHVSLLAEALVGIAFFFGDYKSKAAIYGPLAAREFRLRTVPIEFTMMQTTLPKDRGDFPIALICALPLEAGAVIDQFDQIWGDTGNVFGQAPGDPNAYTLGRIGLHNVILAHTPCMGKSSAAGVAASIRSSFLGVQLVLVVGVCGGVPAGGSEDIRLGDVVISEGIVEYDFRKQYPDKSVRKNNPLESLGRPNPTIRSLVNKLKEDWSKKRLRVNTSHNLKYLQQKSGRFQYPGLEADQLFEPTYRHKHHYFPACTICSKCKKKDDEVCQAALGLSCSELKCSEKKLVRRCRLSPSRETTLTHDPMIHFGLVASGDTVMKSGEDRDVIAKMDGVIAFEMEGAGVWDKLPCIVIKGVCDYADSHKNKDWQVYSAAAAASCMKAFLKEWSPAEKLVQSTEVPSE
jgi:nucleoside phosphorylase